MDFQPPLETTPPDTFSHEKKPSLRFSSSNLRQASGSLLSTPAMMLFGPRWKALEEWMKIEYDLCLFKDTTGYRFVRTTLPEGYKKQPSVL